MYLTIRMPSCLKIQCFNSTHSPNEVSEAFQGNLLLTVQHMFHLWDAMSLHWSSSDPPPPPPNPRLEKERIYRGLGSIVSMGLCSHSQFPFHQKVLLGSFYLRVRDCHRTLFQPLSSFGPTTLLIVLYVFSSICCYRLDHTCFS